MKNTVLTPTRKDPIIINRDVFKSCIKEIATEMVRWSTSHWDHTDKYDIMGDGKRLPKAQNFYRQHYDFIRSCLRRHHIEKESNGNDEG